MTSARYISHTVNIQRESVVWYLWSVDRRPYFSVSYLRYQVSFNGTLLKSHAWGRALQLVSLISSPLAISTVNFTKASVVPGDGVYAHWFDIDVNSALSCLVVGFPVTFPRWNSKLIGPMLLNWPHIHELLMLKWVFLLLPPGHKEKKIKKIQKRLTNFEFCYVWCTSLIAN